METLRSTLSPEKLEKAAYILKTIAHPIRLSIVDYLSKVTELSVNQLCDLVQAEQSLVSHHLQNMRLKGILKVRKEGVSCYYSLKEKNIISILHCVEQCDCTM
ncbi:MAG: metalloregulator ArsR/SmtB family transcription factor [Cytophagaceae bacterium]|jgi:ArsR family transcriptional regulator|nr:metalloregulator ArsR/SmtB family transcription factor [Cytophagaceae bacterium]